MSPQDKCELSFYRDLEPIGGSGKVMLVRHIESGQVFVKKRLSRYNSALYRYLKQQNFPGIPMIYGCYDDDDFVIVIEEYISGKTLRRVMDEQGPLPESTAKRIIALLCDTLDVLHHATQPVVCRDLKPENIILTRNNRPVIIDLDAAKFAHIANKDTILLGTPGYAAPEQFGFAASDERTDVYALGVILNEMLTGELPQNRLATGPCRELIKHCTNLDPDARVQSVSELRGSLHMPANLLADSTGRSSYTLPGFRTGLTWKKIIAVLGYFIGGYMTVYYIIGTDDPLVYRIAESILWALLFVWTVAFGFDYLGIRNRMPLLTKIKNDGIRRIVSAGVWVFGCLLIFGAVILGVMAVAATVGINLAK